MNVIPQNELIVGFWYLGVGRYGVARWGNDLMFHSVGLKFGQYTEFSMVYGERGFDPLELIKERGEDDGP